MVRGDTIVRIKKGDLVLTALMLLFALSLSVFFLRLPSDNAAAVITLDGAEQGKIVLTGLYEPLTLTYSNLGYTNTVRAENGRICVIESTCPSQDCVHTGWISKAGQSIVCLKTRLIIRIEGGSKSEIDAVVG